MVGTIIFLNQNGGVVCNELFNHLNQNELEQLGRNIQLLPPKSQYIEIGVGKIDRSIASLIEFLNKEGFVTLASCSGMKSDHVEKDINNGYISFDSDKSGEKLNDLMKIAKSLGLNFIEEGDCYFRKAITLM